MHLAVVIVSYNVRSLLRACLRSVYASAEQSGDWLAVEVVVVDNASADGSARMVAAEFPEVHLVASAENLGFTGGNNCALALLGLGDGENDGESDCSASHPFSASSPQRRPPPDAVLLLNPDTEVVGDALGQMAAFLRENPDAGACGPRLHYPDGSLQHAAFAYPGLAQILLDLYPLEAVPGLRRLLPRLRESRLNGRYPRQQWQGTAAFPVDFVLGAALMARREAIQRVGLLDEGYFMYCEEMDWCLRMQQAGLSVFALPRAQIVHHEAQSSRQVRWAAFVRLWRSRFRFYGRHRRRYPRLFHALLGPVVRLGLAWRRELAWRRFARGTLPGDRLDAELAAYRAVTEAAGAPARARRSG